MNFGAPVDLGGTSTNIAVATDHLGIGKPLTRTGRAFPRLAAAPDDAAPQIGPSRDAPLVGMTLPIRGKEGCRFGLQVRACAP